MKKIIILILLGLMGELSGMTILQEKERYGKKSTINKKKRDPRVKELVKELKNNNMVLKSLQERMNDSRVPIVLGESPTIGVLSQIPGRILDSVLAVNSATTRIVVYLNKKRKVRCRGISFGFRVRVKCDLLITPNKNYPIKGYLKDALDGVDALQGDEVYSGEEESFLKNSFVSLMGGVFDASKERLITPWGESDRTTAKNKILNGLLGVTGTIKNKISKDAKNNLRVVILYPGKKVLVVFDEEVKL